LDKLLSIGKILNFHGIQGEVKVGFSEGTEDFLTQSKIMYIEKNSEKISLTPTNVRFHKNFALIKFKEINSIDEVMTYKGDFLKVSKEKIKKFLKKDEFYIDDLIGLSVFDQNGEFLGTISAVSKAGVQDRILVKNDQGKEHIIPFVKDIVPDINLEEKKLIIKNIEGLI